uniref:Uncharacterized protein n=1 Tax=Arundo donax TaxID=35708 RepID=A0A0A9G3F8_ARUDO
MRCPSDSLKDRANGFLMYPSAARPHRRVLHNFPMVSRHV